MALALFSGNNNALLFETLKAENKENKYHHYLGRVSSMFQVGLGTSALVASFIAPHGLRIVFICGIVPQILATIVSLFFIEPRKHIEVKEKNIRHIVSSAKQVCHNPRLRLLTLARSFDIGVGEACFMFTNVFVNSLWPIWAVAIYRALAHTFAFGGFWFSGRILDRIKSVTMMISASAYGLASALVAIFLSNIFSPLILVTGSAFFGPSTVAFDHMLQREFTDKQRATMGSVVSFASRFMSGAAGILFGFVADHFGVLIALAGGILASGVALPLYIRLFRKHR